MGSVAIALYRLFLWLQENKFRFSRLEFYLEQKRFLEQGYTQHGKELRFFEVFGF
jgi:hypothetical protein